MNAYFGAAYTATARLTASLLVKQGQFKLFFCLAKNNFFSLGDSETTLNVVGTKLIYPDRWIVRSNPTKKIKNLFFSFFLARCFGLFQWNFKTLSRFNTDWHCHQNQRFNSSKNKQRKFEKIIFSSRYFDLDWASQSVDCCLALMKRNWMRTSIEDWMAKWMTFECIQ